jgi:hypothetical protein
VIEVEEIESLRQYKYFADAVATGPGERGVVATEAGVRVGARETVEIPREHQRRSRIGERRARSFGAGTALAFLRRPPRLKELAAEGD